MVFKDWSICGTMPIQYLEESSTAQSSSILINVIISGLIDMVTSKSIWVPTDHRWSWYLKAGQHGIIPCRCHELASEYFVRSHVLNPPQKIEKVVSPPAFLPFFCSFAENYHKMWYWFATLLQMFEGCSKIASRNNFHEGNGSTNNKIIWLISM